MTQISQATRASALRRPRPALGKVALVLAVLDAAVLTGTALVAMVARVTWSVFEPPAGVQESVAVAGPLMILAWLGAIWLFGGYELSDLGAGSEEFKAVFNASITTAGVAGVACYLFAFELSRGFFFVAVALGIPLLLGGRLLARASLKRARQQGRLLHRVVIAGEPSSVDEVAQALGREGWLGYHVIGALTDERLEETAAGVPVLGTVGEAADVVDEVGADVVFFAQGAFTSTAAMRDMAWQLEHLDAQVVVAPSVGDVSGERVRVKPIAGMPLVHIARPTTRNASRWGKRAFDVLGSSLLILLVTPVLAYATLRIKLHDRGPVLFSQTRIGKDGEEFTVLKFRTMVVGADRMAAELQTSSGQSALLFKLREDPRITPPGRWLRRFSIDELPQLFNVWRGDMSLVGPRPQVAREVELYDDVMHRRLHVRPGMTGLWQVSGRNDLSADEAIRLDLYYVDNWSMIQDVSILVRTVGAVFTARGAY